MSEFSVTSRSRNMNASIRPGHSSAWSPTRPAVCCGVILGASLLVTAALPAVAQEFEGGSDSSATEADPPVAATSAPVAATVDGHEITVAQVQRQLQQALRGRPVESAARPFLEAQALQQLVERQLVLKFLAKNSMAASYSEINLAIARLEKELQQRDLKLDDHLAKLKLTREQLRSTYAWRLSWQRYLDRYVTEKNLESYFQKHAADYDGRQLRVAHILLRASPSDAEAFDKALRKAAELRRRIEAEELSFADAARQHSEAPSGRTGGDQGFIERRRPMSEAYSKAAFELAPKEISQPIAGQLGVYLIKCLEVEPGTRTWRDARDELESGVQQFLFEWTASQQRPHSKVAFTGASPYFKPGSRSVVTTKPVDGGETAVRRGRK